MRQNKHKKDPGLLEKNTRPIEIVPRHKRQVWEDLHHRRVRADKPPNQWKKWSEEDIERIIIASPETDTYQNLAQELGRSDGAIRRVRVWAGHILKGEYVDQWSAWVESDDPKIRANKHDVILIHKVLKERGHLDLPVSEQFRLAEPLPQPRGGWRGDRTGEASRRRRKRVRELQVRVAELEQGVADDRHGI